MKENKERPVIEVLPPEGRRSGALEAWRDRAVVRAERRNLAILDEVLAQARGLLSSHEALEEARAELQAFRELAAARYPYEVALIIEGLKRQVVEAENAVAAVLRQGEAQKRQAAREEELKERTHELTLLGLDLLRNALQGFGARAAELGQAQASAALAQLHAQALKELQSALPPPRAAADEAERRREGDEAQNLPPDMKAELERKEQEIVRTRVLLRLTAAIEEERAARIAEIKKMGLPPEEGEKATNLVNRIYDDLALKVNP